MPLNFACRPFSRADLQASCATVQRNGRMFNAFVTVAEIKGKKWTVKDFSNRPFFVRPLARVVLWRELRALDRLKGIDGVAQEAFMVDGLCLAASYIEGEVLKRIPGDRVTVGFLSGLENLTRRIHEAGIVHLDLRSLSNVLMRPDGTPAIIDFQAALCTRLMPKWLKKMLEDFDLSGAYKKWLRYRPDEMGSFRRSELARINHLRRFWVLRGYFGRSKHQGRHT